MQNYFNYSLLTRIQFLVRSREIQKGGLKGHPSIDSKSEMIELFLCDARRQIRSIVSLCEEFDDRRTRAKRANQNDFLLFSTTLLSNQRLLHLNLEVRQHIHIVDECLV